MDVARALAIPQSRLDKVELGIRQLPFIEGIRLAAIYEVDPRDLVPNASAPSSPRSDT
jgi:hypothetical protein